MKDLASYYPERDTQVAATPMKWSHDGSTLLQLLDRPKQQTEHELPRYLLKSIIETLCRTSNLRWPLQDMPSAIFKPYSQSSESDQIQIQGLSDWFEGRALQASSPQALALMLSEQHDGFLFRLRTSLMLVSATLM